MKTRYFFLIALLSAASVVSCQQMEKPIFTSPASSRMENVLDRFQNVLSNPKGGNGWYMAYFTQQDKTMGGSIYTIQFDKPAKGEATIFHEDVTPAAGWGDSCNYKLSRDDGPVLSFDTYNVAMHYFSTSSSEYYQSRGGDFEFELMSACPDSVVMRGKRSRNIFKMYPLEEAPDTYIKKIKDMNANLTLGLVEAEITGGLIQMQLDLNNRTITIGRKGAAEDELVSVPYIITPTGFRLYDALDFQGVIFKDFVFDAENLSLKSNGITFNMVIPEGFMKYDRYLGKYKMTTGALGNFDVEIVEDVHNRTYLLKGLHPKFDIKFVYNAGQGAINWFTQSVGRTEEDHEMILCAWCVLNGQSGTFTWATTAGMRSVVDNPDIDNFVLTMADFGTMSGNQVDSYLLFDYTEYSTSQTVNTGFPASWNFPGGNYRLVGPFTFTKIVE